MSAGGIFTVIISVSPIPCFLPMLLACSVLKETVLVDNTASDNIRRSHVWDNICQTRELSIIRAKTEIKTSYNGNISSDSPECASIYSFVLPTRFVQCHV